MAKIIVERVIFFLFLAGLMALLGFAGSSNMQKPVKGLHVSVASANGNYFVCPPVVHETITHAFDSLKGRVISQETLEEIYQLVNDIPWVEQTAVYRTINASVNVDIRLKKPLLRVINRQNESFYVDVNGNLFPLSEAHTARVMLVTGHVPASLDETSSFRSGRSKDKSEKAAETLEGIYTLASYIAGDPFLNAFIDNIYVHRDGHYDLTPKNGAHIIEFGDASDMEKKFNKLRTFYSRGINQVGWHHYNRVNVAYKNQVICSK